MSDKALIYDTEPLRHRMLCIGEFAGLQNDKGNAWLRQLLTEGKLDYKVVVGKREGGHETHAIQKEGPTGAIVTTTIRKVYDEDETRFLSLYIDETDEQRRGVLLAKARKAERLLAEKPNVEPWQALQSWIASGSCEYVIPFAKELAMGLDISQGRVTRDFEKVLSLIGAHALLHQCRRERDAGGCVVADWADYRSVYTLIEPVLSRGHRENVSDAVVTVSAAVSVLATDPGFQTAGVSQRDIIEHLELEDQSRDASFVSRAVTQAVKDGYLINKDGGRRTRVHRLAVGERKRRTNSGLPRPEDLEGQAEG